ncbi:MAG: DinB family protein [Bryobacteraceae bacterium]
MTVSSAQEYNEANMNRSFLIISTLSFACACGLQAQTANPLSTEAKQAYTSVKNNLMRSAEKMPEENYGFKPSPEMRSFAEVLDHVADSQMRACSAALGEQKSASSMAKSSKADVTAALRAAFDECDKAYDALTDAAATEMVKSYRGERPKLGALMGNVSHDNEQYGILTVYMRLKGIIPPSSEAPKGK